MNVTQSMVVSPTAHQKSAGWGGVNPVKLLCGMEVPHGSR